MRDFDSPYSCNPDLIVAVKDYLDQHISYDLDAMTAFVLEFYPRFQDKHFKSFRPVVKEAYKYVAESMKPKKKKKQLNRSASTMLNYSPAAPSGTHPTPNNKKRSNTIIVDCAIPETVVTPKRQHTGGNSSRRRNAKPAAQPELQSDFYVIDVDGTDDYNNDDVAIVECPNEISQLELSTVKKMPQIGTPSGRKRKAGSDADTEAAVDKQVKRALLTKSTILPVVTFEELGGLDPIKKDLIEVLKRLRNKAPHRRGLVLLLSGPPGAGKTALATAIAERSKLHLQHIRLGTFLATHSLNPEKKLMDELALSLDGTTGVLLLTEVDRICRDSGSRQLEREAMMAALATTFTNVRNSERTAALLIIVETSHVELLEGELLQCFTRHIAIKPPTAHARREMLERLCSSTHHSLAPDVDLSAVALRCSGYLPRDLRRLLDGAAEIAVNRCNESAVQVQTFADFYNLEEDIDVEVSITTEDFTNAAKCVQPMLKTKGFPAVPDTTWADVGGLVTIREELRVKMLDPIRDPDLWAKYNKTSSGVLLWGPPGCGKTLLAKAVANEAGVNLLIVNGPDLLSMYQGESERAVRTVFARAASVSPCVIFFDEFDSLCPRRSKAGGESGSKSTIVNTLLTEMSGFLSRPGIYLMAATNLPDVLDPAVLRPGRFDTKLYVGLPDQDGRLAVLNAATKNGTLPALASDVDLGWVASQCQHFSGADCKNLIDTASAQAIEELRAWRQRNQEEHELRDSSKRKTNQMLVSENSEEPSLQSNLMSSGSPRDVIIEAIQRDETEDINVINGGSEQNCLDYDDVEMMPLQQPISNIADNIENFEECDNTSDEIITSNNLQLSCLDDRIESKDEEISVVDVQMENINGDSTSSFNTDIQMGNMSCDPTSNLNNNNTVLTEDILNEANLSNDTMTSAIKAIPDCKDASNSSLSSINTSKTHQTGIKGTPNSSLSSINTSSSPGTLTQALDNPFNEGEYFIYARHFEAALLLVKPSVSEKERFNYEDQARKDFLGK